MAEAYIYKYLKKSSCTGSEACVDGCPTGAIKMEKDESGFYYPCTDFTLCISCGKCVKICPKLSNDEKKVFTGDIETYAGYALEEKNVVNSSSGGMFRLLAESFLEKYNNAKICAVVWDDDFKGVHHEIGSYDQLHQMQRSKYVQSRKNGVYKKIRDLLEDDVPVLFVGCPCETAGLQAYLGKKYEKLFVIDLVCQGPTAPAVLESYISRLQKKYKSRIEFINLRLPAGKNWIPQWSEIRFANKKKYIRVFYETDLGIAVHYMQRESCFECSFRGNNRFSDITLGDFHGIDKKSAYYNHLGTSIVCINTPKGATLFDSIRKNICVEKVDYSEVKKSNMRISQSRIRDKEDYIFCENYKEKGLKKAIQKTLPFKKKIKYYLPSFISNVVNGYKGCKYYEE